MSDQMDICQNWSDNVRGPTVISSTAIELEFQGNKKAMPKIMQIYAYV